MCGIAGQVALHPDVVVDVPAIGAMTRALAHRGPDGEGAFVAPGARAALGHRRLSVIDLATGAQPIANEDGSVVVVFNGEIYNFAALREELERAGHRFSTRSDTEVIAHLYEAHGPHCVARLQGMFAFALWDARAGRFLAARDRLGKKPVYYVEHGGRLSVASEITALYRLADLPWRIDPAAVDLYLTHSYVPSPHAILAAIRKLPPAHRLVVERGTARVERYWSPPRGNTDLPYEEAVSRLRGSLEDAVRRRLVSDVPLGCLLSGGIDSSITVALMARLGVKPLRTFSIGFEDDAYSELPHARQVARRCGAEHEELTIRPDAAAVLPRMVEHFGEPFGDSSALPTWYVCQLARRSVTVALTGDGGDEMFGGYTWYRTGERLGRAAGWLPGLAARSVRHPAGQRVTAALPRRLGKGLRLLAQEPAQRFASLRRTLDEGGRAALYGAELAARADGIARAYLEAAYPTAGDGDLVQAMSLTDVATYLPEDLLVKVDRMSMAWGLEARAPFLDADLVDFALSLPAAWKRRRGEGKRVLRDAFAPLFPPGFFDRPKMGFRIPVDEWLRGPLRARLDGHLRRGPLVEAGIIDPAGAARLLRESDAGRSHGATLWNLLMLAEWFARFGGRARW